MSRTLYQRGRLKHLQRIYALSRHRQQEAMRNAVGLDVTAVLQSTEPGIDLRLHSNHLGQITGTYYFESARPVEVPTALSGGFAIDQSYLSPLLVEIEAALCEVRPA